MEPCQKGQCHTTLPYLAWPTLPYCLPDPSSYPPPCAGPCCSCTSSDPPRVTSSRTRWWLWWWEWWAWSWSRRWGQLASTGTWPQETGWIVHVCQQSWGEVGLLGNIPQTNDEVVGFKPQSCCTGFWIATVPVGDQWGAKDFSCIWICKVIAWMLGWCWSNLGQISTWIEWIRAHLPGKVHDL